ncbi:hypothetical protein KTS45_11165 [Halomicroarcula limicola]|uniref:Uncharacterized protein n=1 Tax=Haloarcula limicola TaxID=1429915 RepID=A0A8J7YAM1_9EURY|nr:hypothetical protein [Halomicroarcula limicola]MBV0924759.1 hypothetical protein [Halomicroarcula limicola]
MVQIAYKHTVLSEDGPPIDFLSLTVATNWTLIVFLPIRGYFTDEGLGIWIEDHTGFIYVFDPRNILYRPVGVLSARLGVVIIFTRNGKIKHAGSTN